MKSLPVIIFLLCCATQAGAQATSGIKIGGNYYSIVGAGESEGDFGYEAGLFSKAELGKKISLLAELDYSVKKATITVSDTTWDLEMNFASVSFSLTYDFSEHFYAAAGPVFSYMIEPRQTPLVVDKSLFTHFAVGFIPSIGFETARFNFLVRYDVGLTVLTLESTPDAKNNLLTGAHFNGVKLIAGVKF